jgi:AcrR family transcriptional regulator
MHGRNARNVVKMLETKRRRSSARNESQTVNFRTRNAQVKREKMLARLLSATMSVCADPARRGNAVIDDVVRAAGVSRGAFYWYFDTLDEAIETLGRRMADEISAETYNVFRSQADPAIRAALAANPVLRAALGGQVMMCRASMDSVWARYLSNVHVLPDDSKFITRVRRNLEAGRSTGELHFESVKVAVDYQVGAVLAAVRRCSTESLPPSAPMEMNVLILRGLGVRSPTAEELATQAARIVDQVGPENFAWWRKSR